MSRGGSWCETLRHGRWRHASWWLVSLTLLLAASTAGAVAKDVMPPTAPAIQRADGTSSQPAEEPPLAEVERSVVRVRPRSEPLSAAVSRTGTLQGGVDFMARVPAGMAAEVNKNVPPEVFRAWIEKAHSQFALHASTSPGDVLCVKGQWDDSARTLDKFRIPYTRIGSHNLKDIPLDHVKVLIVGCAGYVPRESFQRVRDWVSAGGYLITTDWALDHMLQKTFPGYVEWNHKTNHNGMYSAEAVNPDPVLFQYAVPSSNWRMEQECHLLSVMKPESVRVLVRSRGLEREDGQGVLAVTFPFGHGQVLHLVGHFDNNPMSFHFGNSLPDPAPVIGISLRQAIAANFVVAGLTGTRVPGVAR